MISRATARHLRDVSWVRILAANLASHPDMDDTDPLTPLAVAEETPASGSDSLRVLMVTPFYGDGGGVGTVSKELTETLRQKGLEVDVLHWWPGFNSPKFIDSTGQQTNLRTLDDLFRLGKRYDIVHFHSDAFSDRLDGGLTKILSNFNAHSVYTVHCLTSYHGESMGSDPSSLESQIKSQIDTIAKTDKTILLTPDLRKIAVKYHPEHSAKYVTVPNGVNEPSTFPGLEHKVSQLREKYNLQSGDRILLYMGRISPEKGISELAQAFTRSKQEHPELKLVIAGNRGEETLLKPLRETLGYGGLIEGKDYCFAGWVDGEAKEALYKISDFVVMPSYYEHMPMAALESMARKKPVMITDIESIRGVFNIRNSKQRIVIPISKTKDPDSIAESISYALANPGEVDRIVERAYKRVKTNFSWDTVGDGIIQLYSHLHHVNPIGAPSSFEERFKRDFEKRFNLMFEYGFNGYMACVFGDLTTGISNLKKALELNPNYTFAQNHLKAALEKRLEEFRLSAHREGDGVGSVTGIQQDSEDLRSLRYNKPDAPEVSVVIPVHIKKASSYVTLRYLQEAIESILNQRFDKKYELILVDDGSPVNVLSMLEQMYHDQICYIKDEQRNILRKGNPNGKIKILTLRQSSGGPSVPTNIGYEEALRSGTKFITHMDQDDRATPNRLDDLYNHLQNNPATDAVHARHISIDSYGNQIKSDNPIDRWYRFCREFILGLPESDPNNEGTYKRHNAAQILELISGSNNSSGTMFVHNGTTMFRSNVLLRFKDKDYHPVPWYYGEDHSFWKQVSTVATMDYLSRVVVEYRQHPNNLTNGDKR